MKTVIRKNDVNYPQDRIPSSFDSENVAYGDTNVKEKLDEISSKLTKAYSVTASAVNLSAGVNNLTIDVSRTNRTPIGVVGLFCGTTSKIYILGWALNTDTEEALLRIYSDTALTLDIALSVLYRMS